MNERARAGVWAWGGIIAYVLIYDVFALRTKRHTLSAGFHHISTLKVGRPLLVGFWFYLTSHLFRWVPQRYDLFRKFGA